MKRLLMLLTTFCLLLMTTALAETEAEWNAKCEWKTGTGTTLYAVTQGTATSSDLSDFVPVGTLPANTYVGILERSGNMRNVRYWNGSGASSVTFASFTKPCQPFTSTSYHSPTLSITAR